MRRKQFFLAAVTLLALAVLFAAGRAGSRSIRSALGVGTASGTPMVAPPARPPVATAADAEQALRATDRQFIADVGLTESDIATTHAIYTFDSRLGNFAAGMSVFKTSLRGGGYCLTFVRPTACTHVYPSATEPLIGIGYDPDGERSGQPFVVISLRNPSVKAVSYVCAGSTYPAAISGDVVTLIAPSSTISLNDCSEQVTFANGQVLTKPV
jgi:hypothetical protein